MILPPRHKFNTAFNWRNRSGDNLRLFKADDIARFNTKGYALLPGALSAPDLAALLPEIDAMEAQETETVLTMDGGNTISYGVHQMTFACNLAARNPVLRAFASSALMGNLMHDLMGPDVRLYWDQAVYKKPRHNANFAWHQDNGYTYVEPQDYITCWLALTDADASNGCPWILPGLHQNGTFAHDLSQEGMVIAGLDHDSIAERAICTPVKAGDMVIFSSLTPHMTGPNLTNTSRKSYILQYIADGTERVHDDGRRENLTSPQFNFSILIDGKAVGAHG